MGCSSKGMSEHEFNRNGGNPALRYEMILLREEISELKIIIKEVIKEVIKVKGD